MTAQALPPSEGPSTPSDRATARTATPSGDVAVRLSEPWTVVGVHPLPSGWANCYRGADGKLTVEPCSALLVQSSERKRRLVYATEHDGELVAANDRDDYVTTTADWALALRRNGAGYGRV